MKKTPGADSGFFKCRSMRGLIAASIYNDLPQNELQTLQAHLDQCPACRKQADSLKRVAAMMPVATPDLDHDLWPAIRRAARHTPARYPGGLRLSWNTGLAFSLCALLIGGVTYGAYRTYGMDKTPVIAGVSVPIENDLAAVAAMIEDHDYVSAYRRLEQALQASPQSPLAGEARVQLADLAYSKLNWYPEAYEAYDRLFRDHPALFSVRTECISRRELLDEARAYDYAPLYALDAARRAGDGSFARLESVLARYPGTLVASLAAEDMARQSLDDALSGAGESHVAAMECAKERCTNPVAIARLKLEIGHIYVRELNDAAKARSFYAEVANFEDQTLATMAEGSLAALSAAE